MINVILKSPKTKFQSYVENQGEFRFKRELNENELQFRTLITNEGPFDHLKQGVHSQIAQSRAPNL